MDGWKTILSFTVSFKEGKSKFVHNRVGPAQASGDQLVAIDLVAVAIGW